MAIYRGEGGATDVEPAPGDTEFAGGIIVEEDIVSKGKITAEEGFYGDGSNLTNVADAVTLAELGIPNHELITVTSTGATTIPKDLTVNGVTVGEGQGSGLLNTIVGDSAFTSATTGGSNTVLGSNAGKTITSGTGNIVVGSGAEPSSPSVFNEVTIGRPSISTTRLFGEVVAPSFKGDGSLLTGLPPSDDVYTKEASDVITSELQFEINEKADIATTYTKAEVDASQSTQDANIVINNDEIARQQIEITNNTSEIGKNDTAINTNITNIATNTSNIASNTSAIATNTSDIATNTSAIAGLSGAIVYKGNINVAATDAPAGAASGDMYVNNYNEAEPETSYPVTGWGSITSIIYADRVIRTDTDWEILPVSGGGSVPTDTYTKAQIDEQQEIQDTAISGNTSAIGTVSGQVGQNTEDIAELQDSIFFSSAYSADYPSSPNRDPENGNMYLQNVALFTYSYASATQIFASKTDESGNVRQFTAIKPGDSIVLNEVDSPNYGRYELVSVEDVSGSYVVMNVIPKLGQGTVVTGVKVAFQAFPQPGTASIWSELTDPTLVAPEATYTGNIVVRDVNIGTGSNGKKSNAVVGRNATGSNKNVTGYNNVAIGDDAFSSMSSANNSVAVGYHALELNTIGNGNVGVGAEALGRNVEGKNNTTLGYFAGGAMTSGDNNIVIGNNAQTSADGVSNEVTIGNTAVTKTRLNGNVVTEGGFYGNSLSVSDGTGVSYDAANESISYTANSGHRWAIDGSTSMILSKAEGENATLRVTGLSEAVTSVAPNLSVNSAGVLQRTTGGAGAGIGEAPIDGKQYGRQDAEWTEVTGGGAPSVDTAIGMVAPFAMDSVPTGWLHCDGSAVSRTTYSLLYSKVADLYGAGDGSTTFNLPNLQDEFVRGSSDTLPVGTKQDDEFKAHTHIYSKMPGTAANAMMYGDGAQGQNTATSSTGGTETRPRNVAMLYCINATAEPSSGGGSYTPEPMVWNDVSAERELGTVYTNTQDVPIYVQAYFSGTGVGANNVRCSMDGEQIGYVGNNSATGGGTYLQMPMFIVPAGSTYEFEINGGTSLVSYWREARMPVAVGTGGKTVAFRGELSADQTDIATTTWTKVNLDTSDFDTDSALTDGKFQPSVAGYYQINGTVTNSATSSVNSSRTLAGIYKNGNWFSKGDDVGSAYGIGSKTSNVVDVVYLNGTTDYIELYAYLDVASGTARLESSPISTYLSAVLVSGGSGDSIWTEEDGKAIYLNDVGIGTSTPTFESGTGLEIKNASTLGGHLKLTDSASTAGGTGGFDLYSYNRNGYIENYEGGTAETIFRNNGNQSMSISSSNQVEIEKDLKANGLTIGQGANSGANNTALGSTTLDSATSGFNNTAVGYNALRLLTEGQGNTTLGYLAGNSITTGNNNTVIGNSAQPSSATVSNEITIGNESVATTRLRGNVLIGGGLNINNPGTSTGIANAVIGTDGTVYRTTNVSYSTQDVDKMLAIKDKLIEKLSARLDELEKKVN